MVQLLVMASSPVILAHFAELVANHEIVAVRSIIAKSAVASAILGVLGIVLVGVIGAPLLTVVFGGRFDAEAATRVAHHWWWMTTGLAFLILGNVFAKLWQSQQRPRQISVVAAAGLVVLVATFFCLKGILLEFSVPAAMSASAVAIVVLGVPRLRLHVTNIQAER
jgi:peptidoglycan biosynthesis protein MviN/MurJ (putative lipid II flippase)